jgi:multiple sugar transport system permease protein
MTQAVMTRRSHDAQPTARVARSLGKTASLLILVLGGLFMLVPLAWMLSASLMPLSEVIKVPPVWFDLSKFSLNNYRETLIDLEFAKFFLNSLLIATLITAAQLFTSSMAGYAFARFRFPGRSVLFVVVLSTLMIPFQVIMIPLFLMMIGLNLDNTFGGLIIPAIVSPFGIFMMRQSMMSIPTALLEAARIDGASEFFIFFRIVLPLSRTALAALGILIFLASWDNYLWPLIITNSEALWTLPIGMARLTEQYLSQTHLQMAGAAIMFLPILIVFLVLQRHFIEGIALGGLKG